MTIHEKDYPLETYNYSMFKSTDSAPNIVYSISVSLGITGRNDLDSIMVDGSFSCTLTVYDETGAMSRRLELEGAEFTTYSENASEQSNYSSLHMTAGVVRFDGRHVTSQNEWN